MTESELCSIDEAHSIFDDFEPRPFVHVDILSKGKSALEHANTTLGLALSDDKYCESSQTNSWPVPRRQLSNRH
jgi:phosphoribosylformylglycinamidine synthase